MVNTFFLCLVGLFALMVLSAVVTGLRIRLTTGHGQIQFLDKSVTNTIRGISITMIMISHIIQQLGERLTFQSKIGQVVKVLVFSMGGVGVGLFFLLSGFGNAASLLKTDNNLKITWLLKRIFRLLVSFILSFILIFFILKFTNLCDYTAKETLVQFLHLSLPYTRAWYFKIQLLFYLFVFLSFLLANALLQNEAKKRIFINTLLFSLVLAYALIAKYLLELPDYWWKNSICFSLGCFLYYERPLINKIRKNNKTFVTGLLLIFLAFAITYLYAMKYYTSVFCLICFPVISFALCFIMNELNVFNGIFTKIGNISLELYLLHIGLLKIIDMKILPISGDTELIANIAVFLILSFVLAFMTNRVNSKIFQTFTK